MYSEFIEELICIFADFCETVVTELFSFFKEGYLVPGISVLMVIIYVLCINAIYTMAQPTDYFINKPLLYVFVTTGFSAWLTFILTQYQSSRSLRKSQSLSQMMSSREAANYQKNLRIFHQICDLNDGDWQISLQQFNSWKKGERLTSANPAEAQLEEKILSVHNIPGVVGKSEKEIFFEVVESLNQLINYYEFLAHGIFSRVFDESVLKETVRGMFCELAYRVEHIVHDGRETDAKAGNFKAWENFAYLYFRWELPGRRIDSVILGPRVPHNIVNIGFLRVPVRMGLLNIDRVLARPI